MEKDGVVYIVNAVDRIDSTGNINNDISEEAYPLEGSKRDFIKKCVENHVRRMLRDESSRETIDDSYPKLELPLHLRKLVLTKLLSKWTDRAIIAMFKYEEGKHYILQDNKIQPVDALNTGIVQGNTSWSFGLHQFLEIKHGCKMSIERITTNYLSNVSFFNRYEKRIYGLTGTLGGTGARKLLEETYLVDSLIIPPFRSKQFHQLPPLVCSDEEAWLANIVATCLQHLKNNRAVLVITRYIKEAEKIVSLLQKQYNQNKIKEYKTQADSAVVQSPLEAGEMIVATNIAGRGTDIKPSFIVEENGGLHVCITFITQNERVEEQNIGRTSRTGNRGTSQTIILSKDKTYDILLRERNDIEKHRLEKAKDEIKRIAFKDAMFKAFCNFLKEIRSRNTIEFIDVYIRSIEEQFGIWLLLNEELIYAGEIPILKAFNIFKEQVEFSEINPERCIKNAAFFVILGNQYLFQDNFTKAIYFYDKAIELDPNFSHNAYYSRGYAKIAKFGTSIKTNTEEVQNAVKDFKKSRNLIKERISELHLIQGASSAKMLSEQVN